MMGPIPNPIWGLMRDVGAKWRWKPMGMVIKVIRVVPEGIRSPRIVLALDRL